MDAGLLQIYLRDHHAAAAGGVALARRALGAQDPIAAQIARDRETLEAIMEQLGVSANPIKVGLVRIVERLSRLKLNGRFVRHSPLSRVVELETLVVGVRGKEALWTALRTAGVRLEGIDLETLVDSARAQGSELEARRVSAVSKVFAGSAPAATHQVA